MTTLRSLYFHDGRWLTWGELRTVKPGLGSADRAAKRSWQRRHHIVAPRSHVTTAPKRPTVFDWADECPELVDDLCNPNGIERVDVDGWVRSELA